MIFGEPFWCDPKPSKKVGRAQGNCNKNQAYKQVLNCLKEYPGKWAIVGMNSTNVVTWLVHRFSEFEFTTRGSRANRTIRIYARYVGNNK